MIRRPPRSTQSRSSAASDVYKRQRPHTAPRKERTMKDLKGRAIRFVLLYGAWLVLTLSLIHISEPTRLLSISYAVFCLKKKQSQQRQTVSYATVPHIVVTMTFVTQNLHR